MDIFNDSRAPENAAQREKFEARFADFKADYAQAGENEKRDVVNALLSDVAVSLENYIHRRNKPKDVCTGTVLARSYLSVSKYFIEGSGDPEHYETGAQFVLLLKRVVSQSICARIRQYVREHGGASDDGDDDASTSGQKGGVKIVSIDGSQNGDDAPTFQLQTSDDFVADLEKSELVDILCKLLANAERGDDSLLDADEIKLLELRYKQGFTLEKIAKRFKTNIAAVRRDLARVLAKLERVFRELGFDGI